MVSAPEMAQGKTYVLTIGEEQFEIEMDELIYGTGGGFGGSFGGRGNRGPGEGDHQKK